MACSPPFLRADAVGVHFDNGAVETHGLDLEANQLLMLQFFEQSIQHAGLRPAVHSRVDRVPVAEALRQAAPFAAVLRDVQNRVSYLEITERDVATLCCRNGSMRLN